MNQILKDSVLQKTTSFVNDILIKACKEEAVALIVDDDDY